MSSLRDWYEYLDRVSRPARKGGEGAPDTDPSWRPWNEEPTALSEGALRSEDLPQLSTMFGGGGLTAARHDPTSRFVDPTLDDELEPIPSYAVPLFEAPVFQMEIPKLDGLEPGELEAPETAERDPAIAPSGVQTETLSELDLESEPELDATSAMDAELLPESAGNPGRRGEATTNGPAGGQRGGLPVMAPRQRALLQYLRSRLPDAEARRSTLRESREELIERLVDPTLTLEETARLLGVCPTTVRRYTNRGHLRHFRTKGNQRRFHFSDVIEFLETRAAEIEADSAADAAAGMTDSAPEAY
jgi:excisionase family DNA binding protein